MSNQLAVTEQFGLPEAHHAIPACRHVGVLRGIQQYAFALPGVRLWKLRRVAVPVVAIELNNERGGRDEGVDTELSSNEVLREVLNATGVKNRVPGDLALSTPATTLLHNVHCDELLLLARVRVATGPRTVANSIDIGDRSRRRPMKRLAARLTSMTCLVATTMSIGTSSRAKTTTAGVSRICGDLPSPIHKGTALCARFGVSLLARWSRTTFKALTRAILPVTRHALRDAFLASLTDDRADCSVVVSTHNNSIAPAS